MRTTVVATPDPPPTGIPNPIHAEDGATGAGYRGALVAGVRTYGWVADAVRAVTGTEWLAQGWADVTLRRPLYAGELVAIDLDPQPGIEPATWSVRASVEDSRVVLDGRAGLGVASWFDTIRVPARTPAEPPPRIRPTYSLDDVPKRQPLRSLGAYVNAAAARRLATEDLGLTETTLPVGAVHPWFLAARMAPLTRHNFTYGPTIHVRTQIQHLAVAAADHQIVISAQIVDAYERNDHWYQVLDGTVWDDTGQELARLKHTSIFRPRGTEMPPPIVTEDGT